MKYDKNRSICGNRHIECKNTSTSSCKYLHNYNYLHYSPFILQLNILNNVL